MVGVPGAYLVLQGLGWREVPGCAGRCKDSGGRKCRAVQGAARTRVAGSAGLYLVLQGLAGAQGQTATAGGQGRRLLACLLCVPSSLRAGLTPSARCTPPRHLPLNPPPSLQGGEQGGAVQRQ